MAVAVQVTLAPCATVLAAQVALPPALGWALAAIEYWRGALHWAVVPPWLPVQFQLKAAAVRVTLLAVPTLHKLLLGETSTASAWALPQTPSIAAAIGVTVAEAAEATLAPLLLVATTVKV